MVSISIVIPGVEPRPHMQPSRTELQFKELTTIIFSKHLSLIYIFSYNYSIVIHILPDPAYAS